MKTKIIIALVIFIFCKITSAQDTMYLYKSGKVVNQQAVSKVDSFVFYKPKGTVTDADGNVYHTVTIGTQTWMVENLRTTKYNDGTPIPKVTHTKATGTLTTPGVYTYNNTTNMDTIILYGLLYTWNTVNTGKIAPIGWHVPTEDELATYENYLTANGYNYDGTTTGAKFAKALASVKYWNSSLYEGAVGNTDYPEKRNITGFTGLPGGALFDDGSSPKYFNEIGNIGYWWTSTAFDGYRAYSMRLEYNNRNFADDAGQLKGNAFSVRCILNSF